MKQVFNNYMNKLIEFNGNLDRPVYRFSLFENLQQNFDSFEVPDLDTKINKKQPSLLETRFISSYTISIPLFPESYA